MKIPSTHLGGDSESGYYIGSIVRIKEKNYGVKFGARGYMEIQYAADETGYIYTPYDSKDNCRSISEVAEKVREGGYKGLTAAQIEIVNSYITGE